MLLKKKALALASLLAVLIIALAAPASAASMNDIKGHWCEERIAAWVDQGIMDGYPDGTFRPEGDITRAEFVKITNKAFGFSETGVVPFSDVKTGDWFYEDVRTAYHIGYINGYPDGTFRPNGNITRQEAAKVICTILSLRADYISVAALSDQSDIADWARGYIGAVYANRIMGAYSDGSFRGNQRLTRAECVYSLWNGLELAGGPKTSDYTVKGASYNPESPVYVKNLMIDYSGDVDISNVTVTGNVYVTSRLDGRTVTLRGCKITGSIVMEYGSLVLDGSVSGGIQLASGKTGREITLKNASSVTNAFIDRSATINQSALTAAGKGIESLAIGSSYTSEVVLRGSFPRVYTQRSGQTVILASGTIKELESSYSNTYVTLGQATTVEYAYLAGSGSRVLGPGELSHAYIDSTGITLQRAPAKLSGPRSPYITGDYKLSITVKDISSSKALVGAEIKLDTYTASGKTGASGAFEFTRVTDKLVYFTVSLAGYKDYTGSVSMDGGNKYIEVKLTPTGEWRASLAIVDADTGNPITGAYGYITSLENKVSSPSDANGRMYFEGLGSTTYTYKISVPGYVTETGSFTVGKADLTISAPIKLQKTKVNITVFEEAQQNRQITSFEYYAPGYTNGYIKATAGGLAVIQGIPAGTAVTVRVRALTAQGAVDAAYIEGTVTVTADDSKTPAAFKTYLVSSQTYTYSVTVLSWDGKSVVDGATVRLSSGQWSGSAVTINGVAQITGVPRSAGYTLTVSRADYQTYTANAVTVDASNLSSTVRLVGIRTVGVTVNLGGAPLPGMTVVLESVATGNRYSAATNAAGLAQIANVPDGEYKITGVHSDYMLDPGAAADITVGPGATSFSVAAALLRLDFTLVFLIDNLPAALPAGIQVTLTGPGESQTRTITQDESDIFSLPKGTYTITIPGYDAAPAQITVINATGGTQIGVSLSAQPAP